MSAAQEFDVPVARVAKRTESIARMSRRALAEGRVTHPPSINIMDPRPRTWGECQARELGTGASPCPYASCAHHLYVEVNADNGSITFPYPDREPHELAEQCSLRVAERTSDHARTALHDSHALESIAAMLNVSREWVRCIEEDALAQLRAVFAAEGFALDAGIPEALRFEEPAPAIESADGESLFSMRVEVLDTPHSAAMRARAVLRGGGSPAELGKLGRLAVLWGADERRRIGRIPTLWAIECAVVAMRRARTGKNP